MKRIIKIIDERQELEMLRIEHVGFWIVFWALLVSIIVQIFFLRAPIAQVAAEWIVFMICCISTIIGSIKKGQWDYYTKPGMKTYLIYSFIGSFVFSAIAAVALFVNNDYMRSFPHVFILLVVIMFLIIFTLLFVALLLGGNAVIKRRQKLEKEYCDEEDKMG